MNKKLLPIVMALVIISSFWFITCFEISPKANSDWPFGGYSFGGNFDNWATDKYDLNSFGNLAFTDKGVIGKGIELIDGYMEVKNSKDIELKKSFTYSCWLKINDKAPQKPMLFSRESSSGDIEGGPVSIYFSPEYNYLRTDISFVMNDKSVQSYSFASGFIFSPNTVESVWHNIAVVFDNDILYYYIDGYLSSQEKIPEYLNDYKSIANSKKNFTIGRGASGNLKAVLDEVRIYDGAINAEGVKLNYDEAKQQYSNKIILKKNSSEINVNGKISDLPIKISEDAVTQRLMVPIRAIVENMGGGIAWVENDGYGRADICLKDANISIWLYDTNAIVNNKYFKLDAYPTKINDVTCVPVRFVAEELGALVEWNEETQEVIITY